jgi:hypothetical protein
MDEPLTVLLERMKEAKLVDWATLSANIDANPRRLAFEKLRIAVQSGDIPALQVAASDIRHIFNGKEYLLDMFFAPPNHHQHGGILRKWLAQTEVNSLATLKNLEFRVKS